MSDSHHHQVDRPADPAAEPRADYDYRSPEVERPDLLADLEPLVEGDVRLDSDTRELYATDASAYEQRPIGVVAPVSTQDVVAPRHSHRNPKSPTFPRSKR